MEEASARTIILSEAKDDRMEAGIDTMEAKDGTTYCKNAAILIHYYAKSAHISACREKSSESSTMEKE